MKSLNTDFLAALSAESRSITRCVKITRTDGVTFGFTECDRNLVIDGVTYQSALGFSPTAIQSNSDLSVNNLELGSLLDSNGVTATDIKRGAFDYARVLMFLVNPFDLPSSLSLSPPKHLSLPGRTLGKFSYSESDYTAELLGLTNFLQGRRPVSTSKTCRYQFGDNNCGVNLEPITQSLTVQGQVSALSFASSSWEDDYFTGGLITFTSGALDGLQFAIAKQLGIYFHLASAMPSQPEIGDQFDAIPNCQKTPSACKRFNNYLNFGGEELPGLDAYYSQEDQG